MMASDKTKKTACVTGGTGYIAALLVEMLVSKGYAVNTTTRNPEDENKVDHLLKLQDQGDVKLFRADLTDEGSFDDAVAGCDIVFHVATPVKFDSEDPEVDMINPAIKGTIGILKACLKSNSVKRVVLTSSAAAVSINNEQGMGHVMEEGCWSDVDFLTSTKPFGWGYPVSKTLAEKAAWKFAEENKIDLITVIPCLVMGPSPAPYISSSFSLTMSLLTGNNELISTMKGMQIVSGSISITHVEDVVNAHIFLAESESASGRYICCNANTSLPELAKFLNNRYPQYDIPTDFQDVHAEPKLRFSSEKLIREGFSFKYKIEEMYDQSVEYFKSVGLLQN